MKTKNLIKNLFLTLVMVVMALLTTTVNAAEIIPEEEEISKEVYRIPFTKIVTGTDAPAEKFEFEAKYTLPEIDLSGTGNISIDLDTEISLAGVEPLKITIPAIETDGEKEYDGIIIIEGSLSDIDFLKEEGFTVKEKNTGAENWTYSTEEYYVVWEQISDIEEGKWIIYNTKDKLNTDTPYVGVNPVEKMTFTNTYVAPVIPEEPVEIENPSTSDNFTLYSSLFVVALFGISYSMVLNKSKEQ